MSTTTQSRYHFIYIEHSDDAFPKSRGEGMSRDTDHVATLLCQLQHEADDLFFFLRDSWTGLNTAAIVPKQAYKEQWNFTELHCSAKNRPWDFPIPVILQSLTSPGGNPSACAPLARRPRLHRSMTLRGLRPVDPQQAVSASDSGRAIEAGDGCSAMYSVRFSCHIVHEWHNATVDDLIVLIRQNCKSRKTCVWHHSRMLSWIPSHENTFCTNVNGLMLYSLSDPYFSCQTPV